MTVQCLTQQEKDQVDEKQDKTLCLSTWPSRRRPLATGLLPSRSQLLHSCPNSEMPCCALGHAAVRLSLSMYHRFHPLPVTLS